MISSRLMMVMPFLSLFFAIAPPLFAPRLHFGRADLSGP
jgi:hypothetical protein